MKKADILLVEDDLTIRTSFLRRIRPHFSNMSVDSIGEGEINPAYPVEEVCARLANLHRRSEYPRAIALDLHLGKCALDGLEVVRNIRHFNSAGIVIVSSQVQYEDVREEARGLGLCLLSTKEGESLPQMLKAAMWLGDAKNGLITITNHIMTSPTVSCDRAGLVEVCQAVTRMGIQFDGSEESIDWDEARQLDAEFGRLATAAWEWLQAFQNEMGANGITSYVKPEYGSSLNVYHHGFVQRLQMVVRLFRPHLFSG